MRVRGLVIGFAGAILIASCGYINDSVLRLESFTSGSQLPIIVIGLLFLLLVALNPLLMLFNRNWSLQGSELAVIVALWSASCSIPGRGLLEQFTHSMVMPYYWETQMPSWRQNHLFQYVNDGHLVTLPPRDNSQGSYVDAYDRVVSGYVRGASDHSRHDLWSSLQRAVMRVPWSAWRAPLTTWLPLVLLSALASVCLALITHRQWSQHEMLSYPIASFLSQLLVREPSHLLPAVFHSRMFWLGFLALFMIRLNNWLCAWFPDVCIPITMNINMSPFGRLFPGLSQVDWGTSLLNVRIFPLVIAFAFFLSSEIALTIGVSNICWVMLAIPLTTLGWDLHTDWVRGWQGWERAGAYLALFLTLIYTGRHYYFHLLRRSLGLASKDRSTDGACVWAMRLLIASMLVMVFLFCRLGMEWPFALLTLFLMLMMFVVVSRLSAETGLFFIQTRWTVFGLLVAGLGGFFFSPANLMLCGLACVLLCLDQCQALMPYVCNGLKLCERQGIQPAKIGGAVFSVYTAAVLIAVPVLLISVYQWGAPQGNPWSTYRAPTMVFRTAMREIQQLQAVGTLQAAEHLSWTERLSGIVPTEHFLFAFLFGIVGVLLFSFLRLRVSWWPLHPVMFLLWATYPVEQTCHAFLIGWFLKVCCLRMGGIHLVRKLQPMMIGVISGELVAATVVMLAGGLFVGITGDLPPFYRWFPR